MTATTAPGYMGLCRTLAVQESRALRGWARADRMPPRCARIDFWGEWSRQLHTNTTTRRAAA